MTVVIGILALIGLAVVGAIGWAFAHGVRDGLAQWRETPGETSEPVPVGEPPLSLAAALPSSYQVGQLAGEVAASWRSAHQAARAAGPGVPASSSWAAALALGNELSQQRQEAGRAMQAAMAQVLQDNEQAVREVEGATPVAVAVSLTRAAATAPVVAACLLRRCRMHWTATARQRVWPVPPGRLTRPRVARRGRAPGGARSTGQLGRMSGSRECLHPSMALRRRPADRAAVVSVWPHSSPTCCVIFARVLQKLQHRLSWPLSGACVHFVSWGGTTEIGQWRRVSRRFAI